MIVDLMKRLQELGPARRRQFLVPTCIARRFRIRWHGGLSGNAMVVGHKWLVFLRRGRFPWKFDQGVIHPPITCRQMGLWRIRKRSRSSIGCCPGVAQLPKRAQSGLRTTWIGNYAVHLVVAGWR